MEVPIQRSDPAPRGFRYIYLYTCIYSTRFKVYVYMGMGGFVSPANARSVEAGTCR